MINRMVMSGVMGLLAVLTLSGCGSPVSVQTQHAQNVDFAGYKTYIWHPQGMSYIGIPVQRAQLAGQAVKSTVDRELSLKGIKPATFEAPGFFITSTIGAVNLAHVKKWGQGTGGFTPGKTEVPLVEDQVREGTIVLDFVDNKSGELIWRATAHGAVEPGEDPRAKVEDAVRSMMKSVSAAVKGQSPGLVCKDRYTCPDGSQGHRILRISAGQTSARVAARS